MSDFTIRLATLADADDIAAVHMRSWEYAYGSFLPPEIIGRQNEKRPQMWRMILQDNKDTQYAIEVDGKVVGLIGISEARDEDLPEGCYELQGLYLLPEFIGKGCGRTAMEWVKQEVRERGYRMMSLWVFEKNERARRFYEKGGFMLDESVSQTTLGEKAVRYLCALN